MSGTIQDEAFVSLVTNNGYALGALVLGHSLRTVNTNRQLALMITRDVHPQVRQELLRVWDRLIVVNVFDSEDTANLALLGRPDLGITFTKLHAWKLTEYNKCVFLDSDVMVVQNIDDLFDRPEISAAPDIGWPDCFNSGVFVFVPSLTTHAALIAHALAYGSFDGGDQGLLNSYFSDWSQLGPAHRLPFTYNLHSNTSYTYSPAFNRFRDDVKVVHFLGPKKPWQYSVNLESGEVVLDPRDPQDTASGHFLQRWWDIYNGIASSLAGHGDQTSISEDRHSRGVHFHINWDESNVLETMTENETCDDSPYSTPRVPQIIFPNQEDGSPNSTLRAPQIVIDNEEENRITNERDHSYSNSTQSTSTTTSESHEMRQITSGMANIQFRNLADEQTEPEHNVSVGVDLGQARWEYGQIDYNGVDSYDSILSRLDESLVGSAPLIVVTESS